MASYFEDYEAPKAGLFEMPWQYQERAQKDYKKFAARRAEEDELKKGPKFDSLMDPTTGMINEKYQVKGGADRTALDALKKRALGEGPSSWAKLQKEKQAAEQAGLADQAGQQALSGTAQAQGDLAMQGGLSGGARERLASQGAKNLMFARQGVAKQGLMDRLGIDTKDEEIKTNLLSQLPGQELAYSNQDLDMQKTNIQNTLGQNQQQNQFNLGSFETKSKQWAAKEQADATRKSGK